MNAYPDVLIAMMTVAIFTAAICAALIVTLIYGPAFLRACRELFPRAATPHPDDAFRRSQLELLTQLGDSRVVEDGPDAGRRVLPMRRSW